MGIQDRDYYRKGGKVNPRFEKIDGKWRRVKSPRGLVSERSGKLKWGWGAKARKFRRLDYLIFVLLIVIAVLAMARL